MTNILVIGAGNLGSRHLQSIAATQGQWQVDVFDPSEKSLEIASLRIAEVKSSHRIQYHQASTSLRSSYDFALVATTANARLSVLRDLLLSRKISYLLLEKVLFQSAQDLREALRLLEGTDTRTWVNYPRRQFPYYQELYSRLAGKRLKHLKVQGGDWGLACNALHFLDLFEYLASAPVKHVYTNGLENKVYPSKRAGFVEFYGELTGALANAVTFSISCSHEADDIIVQIQTDSELIEINESKLTFPYQSQLTGPTVEALLKTGDCLLTPLAETVDCNVAYLEVMLEAYQRMSATSSERLPIT